MRFNRRSIVGVGSDILNVLVVNNKDERIRYDVFALGLRIFFLSTVAVFRSFTSPSPKLLI